VQRFAVPLLGQLEEDLRLVDAFPLLPPAAERRLDGGVLAAEGLRLIGVLPDGGVGRLLA
jgi:hypothetical protein